MKSLGYSIMFLLLLSCSPDRRDDRANHHHHHHRHVFGEQDSLATLEQIEKVYATMSEAYLNYDVEKVKGIYTEDAWNIYCADTSNVKHGNENFMTGFQKTFTYFRERKTKLFLQFKIIDREFDSSLAYDVGYYRLDKQDTLGNISKGRPGKFVTVLKKQPNGSWKYKVDIYGEAPLDAFQ